MNINEAYAELGLSKNATKENLNKAFRKLAAKYHPDVCKDKESDLKFKKINEAKQIVEKNIESPKVNNFNFNFNTYNNDYNNFNRDSFIKGFMKGMKPIKIKVKFSFEEAVNGCTKVIKYDRVNKCSKCNLDSIDCEHCGNSRVNNVNVSTSVKFNGPIFNKQIIILDNYGDFILLSNINKGVYGELHIEAEVEESIFTINKLTNNIETDVNISLVESLEGGSVNVKTMYSDVLVKIPSGTKNGTKMRLNGYGPNRKKDHIITINVHYPIGNELKELIKFLKKE